MSKTLSKVMIICAMIVILPLMIAGITYSAYYAIDAKIMFDIAINKSCEAQDSFVKVVADGEEVSANTEIVKSHLKQVNFNASAEGYDFVGWFAGDANEYATALQQGDVSYISTENNLNTGMSEYEKLLAVFNLKEYNVFYKYSLTPDGEESTTPPVAGSNHLAWGDALPTLDYDGYDATFVGWRVLGNTEIINTARPN